ncbi:DISARM anti-phage system protein DrmE domain-containing protein [Cupriavidus pinatubonensis]|uniref:DISARM anti-phage system protein DrmE domain-containing protein n=1 Tax=Cupriavidus pinatubonensis TaxID=248026 RepID=UPI00112BF467|nr:hypothetical protein [Cupriavidus pinatubonensis]TPQ32040.1 hypothetical protein C2U69_27525 [Cupriavidus pinatubonensis]
MKGDAAVVSPKLAGWRGLIEQSWSAVTASELLRGSAEVWEHEGLAVPQEEEAVALAAMGRLLRFGQSVHLSLPIGCEPTLTRLAFYLHRLRLDAAGGLLRSSWLNPISIEDRADLIIFGRPRRMWRDFATSAVMRPRVVDVNQSLDSSEFQRTLLVSGHGDLVELLELLSAKAKPFALVVQITPQGCDENSISLIKVLPEFFPGVPIVALGYTGQALTEPLPMHVWNTRLGDVVALRHDAGDQTNYPLNIEVVAARDPVMDAFVKKLGFMIWNLKRKMEETGGASQELSALMAVDRALRCLNVPLPVHEKGTLRHARGGRYPIRMIESWLDNASRLKGRRGDIQELHSQIMAMTQLMMKDLAGAKPGRGEAIFKLCSDAMIRNQRVSVLVGGRRDAEILQNYLEGRLGPESIGVVTVSQMDGSTAVAPEKTDLAIYAGVLYPSRIHWLGMRAHKKIVVCHPFEHERVCDQVRTWWQRHAIPSAPRGDKQRLWSLQWPSTGHLHDALVDDDCVAVNAVPFTLLDIDGEYPPKMRVAELGASRGFDDWLDVLLTEPTPVQRGEELALESARGVVVLHLEGRSEPIRWGINQQIMRLQGEELEICPAKDLAVRNELVMLVSGEERVATQRDLFDMFVQDNYGLGQTLRIAEKWQDYVNAGMDTFKTAVELNNYLKSKRFNVHNNTVQNWAHGGVIGPQDPAAIRLLADLAQVSNAEKMAGMVANSISVIRNEHRRIGTDLRRAIALSRNRDVSAVQIGTRRFSRDVFDAMVKIAKVVSIERPGLEQGAASPRTIKDVAAEYATRHGSKLLFTPGCERVMRTSTFADVTTFGKVLQVLVDGFYPMLADRSKSLKDVEAMLAPIPASYAGGMSEVTKGKYEQHYFRVYEGERVDISRHIKLGRAFDPRYTLRLHFHWDALRAKVVVHHAGEHLPTLSN